MFFFSLVFKESIKFFDPQSIIIVGNMILRNDLTLSNKLVLLFDFFLLNLNILINSIKKDKLPEDINPLPILKKIEFVLKVIINIMPNNVINKLK